MARPRLITDEQILSTTRSCVFEHGAQVSLDHVARELGVTGPALLKRFGSRQELLLRALRPPENPPFLQRFANGPDRRALDVQLLERFTDLWAFFEEVVPCISALRESGIPHDKLFQGKWKSPARALHAIARWLELAQEAGLADVPDPESAATAILGAVQTRAFTAHIAKVHYSTKSNREYLQGLVELFHRALAPRSNKRHRQEVA
ncbi:MAG: TetR/AcrR family transcriptional regulator [Myxococcaceae bacterium]